MVDLNCNTLAAKITDEASRFLDRFGALVVRLLASGGAAGDVDGGARRSKLSGNATSAAARGACYQCDFSLERHFSSIGGLSHLVVAV
ncbi:hypothetical protein D9M72_551580 [compost metagenome]